MARYTLRPMFTGGTFRPITTGRTTVGSVRPVLDDTGRVTQYLARLRAVGSTTYTEFAARTEDEAFRGVVARALGFESHEALTSHNRNVRAQNAARRRAAQQRTDMTLGQLLGEPGTARLFGRPRSPGRSPLQRGLRPRPMNVTDDSELGEDQ